MLDEKPGLRRRRRDCRIYKTRARRGFGQSRKSILHQCLVQQALHAYTRGNAWYMNRENELGSIEKGKFADLVVLDRDYFGVTDADMRKIRPVLTVVAGKVVHDTGVVHFDRDDDDRGHDDDDDDDRGHGRGR